MTLAECRRSPIFVSYLPYSLLGNDVDGIIKGFTSIDRAKKYAKDFITEHNLLHIPIFVIDRPDYFNTSAETMYVLQDKCIQEYAYKLISKVDVKI